MYEAIIGVVCAAGSIGSYLLASQIVGLARRGDGRRRFGCRRRQRSLTTEHLSQHHHEARRKN